MGEKTLMLMRRPAESIPMTLPKRLRLFTSRGFTLVELMVVVMIISILAAIAIANYIRMQDHSKTASCISNQRNILETCVVYSMDVIVPDGDMGVEDLLAAGKAPRNLCECPSSLDDSFDDYTITWLGGLPRDVVCDVKQDKHSWAP